MPPQVGQIIHNKYRLLRHIGDGGMGSVYEARHETLGTTVALKFLHIEFSRREGLVQRFLQEARVSAKIQSPHVVRVTDVDQSADGSVFIVLEYLEGRTLQTLYEELYRAGQRISYAEALDYAVQMCDGVEAAHRAGVVHRDLKPDNVMVTLDAKGASVLKLLDFGIAKLKAIGQPGLTRPGVMLGTPEYMAPEQAFSADAVDARADIFSLGVMIFELLGGRRPVGGEDPIQIAESYRAGRIARLAELVPALAPAIATAVHRAMAPLPQDRFGTVAELREALEPYAEAVRSASPSRIRSSRGTIAVTPSPQPVGPAPLPLAEPPRGVAKTLPPEAEPAPQVSGTVIDPPGRDHPHPPDPQTPGSAPVTMGETPKPPARPAAGTMVDAGGRGMTRQMVAGYAPAHPTASGGIPVATSRRRRRGGSNLVLVILGAAVVAGAVTGGVYLASRSSRDDDGPSKRPDPPPLVTMNAPTPPDPPALPPVAPPVPAPVPAPVAPGPGPMRPKPPASSSAEPALPFILPSTLPFPNPFQPAPPPAPAPSGTPSSKPQEPPPPLFPLP